MIIIVDIGVNADGFPLGFHIVDLNPAAAAEVTNVGGLLVPQTPIKAIAALQADHTKLAASGWLTPTAIPGHPAGTTRWDILVAEANKATAAAEVQALKLTSPAVVAP